MARQFKLRLRDGTILAVDQGGLRTWLIDDKAMVQPMGARGWRPLKEIVAEQSLAAAMKPPPGAFPASAPPTPSPSNQRTLADEDIPNIPIKPPALTAPASPDPVLEPPVEALVPDRIVERAPRVAPPAPLASRAAGSAPPREPAAAPAAPAARPVPPPAVPRPAPSAAARTAAAAPAEAARTAQPPAAAPRAARPATVAPATSPPVARTGPPPSPPARAKAPAAARPLEPLIPEPPPEDAPVTIDDLPIIPFKALEEEPSAPRVSVRVATTESQEETDLADQLALVIQREVAEGHAVVIREEDLEELDLVEDDRDVREPAAVPPAAAAAAAVMATGVNRFIAWSTAALASARASAKAVRAKASAPKAARPASRPDHGPPPAPVSSLPVVPLAAETRPGAGGRRLRIAGVAAVAVAVAVAAGIAIAGWMGAADGERASAPPATAPPPLPPDEPQLPPEVAAVAQRLPHLAPDTIQLLLATSPFGHPDPSDVFRRARAAVKRGGTTLTPDEAQELAVLERAVLVRLSPPERERVMAYDRLRAGRDLLPAEDARVLGLVARGARALPAEHRERLQALSGKAIAAALAPAAAETPAAAALR